MNKFLQEIESIPESLHNISRYYQSPEGYERLVQWYEKTKLSNYLFFCGMGTSCFSSSVIRKRMKDMNKSLFTLDASELLHYGTLFSKNGSDSVILVSQSGESAEINRLLEQEAYQQSIAVTNDESSTLGIKSDVVLPLQAGEEKSITTKTYTNSLGLFLLMLAVFYGRKTLSNVCNELHYAADLLLKVTDNSLMDYVKAVYNNEKFIFIGRGPAFVSAQQSALTSMEGLRCLSAAFSGGAFNHGPFEAVDNNLPTIIYADKNSCTYDITKKLIDRISALCDTLLIITNDNHSFSSEKNIAVIPDMECTFPEEMFPILCSMTQYYLLNGIGRERNIELGNFKYGNKITRSE